MKVWTGHATREWLEEFQRGTLSEGERQKLMEHIGSCDFCAELFADFLEEELLTPPAYLKEEILERSQRADMQAKRTICRASRKMRLFLYSVKVSMAVAASLFLVFCISQAQLDVLEFSGRFLEAETEAAISQEFDKNGGSLEDVLKTVTARFKKMNFMEDYNE